MDTMACLGDIHKPELSNDLNQFRSAAADLYCSCLFAHKYGLPG